MSDAIYYYILIVNSIVMPRLRLVPNTEKIIKQHMTILIIFILLANNDLSSFVCQDYNYALVDPQGYYI